MDRILMNQLYYFEESNLASGIKGCSVFALWEIWST